jgi:hypothetical protein
VHTSYARRDACRPQRPAQRPGANLCFCPRPLPACGVQTGAMLQEAVVHEDAIQDMQMAPDEVTVITASLDKTARLIDVETFQVTAAFA